MSEENSYIKYFGFWPLPSNYFKLERLTLNGSGFIDESTKAIFLEKAIEICGDGWRFAVTGDYLCMLHIDEIENDLLREKSLNKAANDHIQISLGFSRFARFRYCESLNAIYFLMFGAFFTGRNHYMLHDFSELTIWSCGRFTYDQNGQALRGGQFVRPPEQQLRRLGISKVESADSMAGFDINIFRDTALYWSVIYELKLVSTAAVGAKVASEHRIENFKASVSLTWLEIEEWLVSFAIEIDIDVYARGKNGSIRIDNETGHPMYKGIKKLINDYPEGTWVYTNKSYLHDVRVLRNQIVHRGYIPNRVESALALQIFLRMFNFRTGLNLRIDTHGVPTQGVS